MAAPEPYMLLKDTRRRLRRYDMGSPYDRLDFELKLPEGAVVLKVETQVDNWLRIDRDVLWVEHPDYDPVDDGAPPPMSPIEFRRV